MLTNTGSLEMKTTMCMTRRVKGVFLFLLLLIASNTMAFAGRPPVVSTKPIDYRIQYFTAPNSGPVSRFEDMNESGAVVGNYFTDSTHVSGYLYDPLLSVSSAINLHSQYLLPAGWYITYPRSINNFGVIVAIVWHATEGERAMLLNPNGTQDQATGKRLATWLPNLAGSVGTYPRKINDQGDILLCAYFSTGEYVPYVYSPGINGSTEYGPTIVRRAVAVRGCASRWERVLPLHNGRSSPNNFYAVCQRLCDQQPWYILWSAGHQYDWQRWQVELVEPDFQVQPFHGHCRDFTGDFRKVCAGYQRFERCRNEQ